MDEGDLVRVKRLPLEEARCVREREAEAAAEIMKVASVSFLRGTDGELTLTVGASPPVTGTSSR